MLPIDPKKMKKFLIKFEYEINEEIGKGLAGGNRAAGGGGGDMRSASGMSKNPTNKTLLIPN